MTRARDIANIGDDVAAGGSLVTTESPSLGRRNLIINGAMQVAQRGTSTTGITADNFSTVDRFQLNMNALGTWTAAQVTDAPNGFGYSHKITCTTADASPAADDYILCQTKIEAQDLQSLSYGNSDAQSFVLSFYIKSNKTGTGSIRIRQRDNSNKQVTPSYTISSADTWERKTIVIAGDTSGVINNDNGTGFDIAWWLNSGSTYSGGSNQTTWTASDATDMNASNLGVGGATSDYFAITGVQLEVGSVATPFEHRSYGEELALCQRYYHRRGAEGVQDSTYYHTFADGFSWDNGTLAFAFIEFPVAMRTAPSFSSGANIRLVGNGTSYESVTSFSVEWPTTFGTRLYINGTGFPTNGVGLMLQAWNDADAFIAFDSEL